MTDPTENPGHTPQEPRTPNCGVTEVVRRVSGEPEVYRCAREVGHVDLHHGPLMGRLSAGDEAFMTWAPVEAAAHTRSPLDVDKLATAYRAARRRAGAFDELDPLRQAVMIRDEYARLTSLEKP